MSRSTIVSPRSMVSSVVLVLAGMATTVLADWPSDPAAPLAVGAADTEVILQHQVASDGATWIAWVDALCLGNFRLQRIDAAGDVLAPGGIVLALDQQLCGTTDMTLAVAPDGSAIIHGGGPSTGTPIYRVAADGTSMWGKGVLITDWIGGFGAALGLDGGDVLLAGHAGMSIFVSRHAADGTKVWTAEVPKNGGSNKRIFDLVPDDRGGAYVLYDAPLAYTRIIVAVHVSGAGESTWEDQLVIVPADPSSSRHTDPVALADGHGGVVVFFTKGREQTQTPARVLMQRFGLDRTLAFPVEGIPVSVDAERQFNVIAVRDEATNDFLVSWRSGSPWEGGQELRAQRITVDGTRLWGETGVTVAPLAGETESHFATVWSNGALTAIISEAVFGTPSVRAHRVDDAGALDPQAIALSGETDAMELAAAANGDAITVTWFDRVSGFTGTLGAQRLGADGALGVATGDVDLDGDVDVSDLIALLAAWGPCTSPCTADVDGDSLVGVSDLLVLLANWA